MPASKAGPPKNLDPKTTIVERDPTRPFDPDAPAEAAVAAAKYWAAQGGSRVVRAAQHLHGGVGVDREYPLHRYYVYARQLELTLGGTTQQLRKLGRLIASDAAWTSASRVIPRSRSPPASPTRPTAIAEIGRA